jgi:hypothetical protein
LLPSNIEQCRFLLLSWLLKGEVFFPRHPFWPDNLSEYDNLVFLDLFIKKCLGHQWNVCLYRQH